MGKVSYLPPTDSGLESTDATGVQTGNTDIPTPEWAPPTGEPERPTLPGCEHMPNLPALEGVKRRVSAQMRADGLLPDRRCGAGAGAWHIACDAGRGIGLAVCGFAYLLTLIAAVAVADSFVNPEPKGHAVNTFVRGVGL